jgi:hypothetical protein
MRLNALILLALLSPQVSAQVSAQAAPVPLALKGLNINLSLFSVFLLPLEEVSIVVDSAHTEGLKVRADVALTSRLSGQAWNVTAPAASGIYAAEITSADGRFHSALNVIVLLPFSMVEDGFLNGYRIGDYPSPHPGRSAYYPQPRGFIEVTQANRNTALSPHFTLAQFLCKQESGYPKYVVLREKLLYLLEDLLQESRAAGYDIDSFGFISGYRTPWYNRSIGNVKYSRHVYGDAADIYIDTDSDGRLDDLNRDGAQDRRDVQAFFDIVDRYKAVHTDRDYSGGLGLYQRNSRHGGFIHVDTRGYRARW